MLSFSALDGTRLFPHASVAVRPGAGHFPWHDDADLFVQTVSAFLR
ncbi:alpha/beta fold hydrolase [Micromonospora sp. NPDC047620]